MMYLLNQLQRFCLSGSGRRTKPGGRAHCLPLRLERLECRLVPSDGTGSGTGLGKDFFNPAARYPAEIDTMGGFDGNPLASVADGGGGYHGVGCWERDGTS